MTAGTKTRLMRSTRRCTGAFEPCASRTHSMILASSVDAPTAVALTESVPVVQRVPADTRPPGLFSTPAGSPVSMLSSTAAIPETTMPSTGMRSPGAHSDAAAGFYFADFHFYHLSIVGYKHGLCRLQPHQCLDGRPGVSAGACLQEFSGQHKGYYHCRCFIIKVGGHGAYCKRTQERGC